MPPLSYRMLNVASVPAGLLGLEELFAELYAQGLTPMDENLTNQLIAGVRQHNFIPKPAVEDYATALRMEYARFYRQKQQGKAVVARNYGAWRGYPREQIPWFPTISGDLCTNCGACLELCARDVYERDENGRVWVAEPFLCMVGCCFCKSVCEPKALLFPGQEMLKNYREKM
ncbi:MAG: ferredoxin family protein [Anaerolineaceae bacterium]